jgi:ribosomal protein L37AE/L43A
MRLELSRGFSKKECSECGCEIHEHYESYIHLCERCINKTEE